MASREKQAYLRGQELGVRKEWTRYTIPSDSDPVILKASPGQLISPGECNQLLGIAYSNKLYVNRTTGLPVEISQQVMASAWSPEPSPKGVFHYPWHSRLEVDLHDGLRLSADRVEKINGLNESLVVAVANGELVPYRVPAHYIRTGKERVFRRYFDNPLRLAELLSRWHLSINNNGYGATDQLCFFIGATGSTNSGSGSTSLKMENIFFGSFRPLGDERPGWIVFVEASIFSQLFQTWIRILSGPAYEAMLSVYGFIIPEENDSEPVAQSFQQ